MNALLVLRELVGGNLVGRHVFRVSVTGAARIGDMQWINRGTRIAWRSYRMRYVTTSAGRNLRVFELFEPPAVNRSVIFRNLVDPKRGIVLSHETRIGVTPPAHLDHLSWCGLADISLRPIHRLHSWTRSVTAMAGNTSKPFSRMNIVFELLDGLG